MTVLVLADTAVIGSGFLSSLGQLFTSPWIVPAVVTAILCGLSLHLNRRSRRAPLVRLPPQDGEVIDDALPMHFERGPVLADDVTEAIERMAREWREKKGERR